ncbi:MAG: hypothetical protein ACT4OY_00320 [Alphaproteobacteria bacterium]
MSQKSTPEETRILTVYFGQQNIPLEIPAAKTHKVVNDAAATAVGALVKTFEANPTGVIRASYDTVPEHLENALFVTLELEGEKTVVYVSAAAIVQSAETRNGKVNLGAFGELSTSDFEAKIIRAKVYPHIFNGSVLKEKPTIIFHEVSSDVPYQSQALRGIDL